MIAILTHHTLCNLSYVKAMTSIRGVGSSLVQSILEFMVIT